MRPLQLTIWHRHFLLPAETDLEQLTERIQEAVRLGGAMIELPGLPPTSVLISPATPVFIERLATNEDSVLYPAVDDFPEAPDYNGF